MIRLLSRVPRCVISGAVVVVLIAGSIGVLLSPLKLSLFPVMPCRCPFVHLRVREATYLLTWLDRSRILTLCVCSVLSRGSLVVVVRSLVARQQTLLRLGPT